MPSRVPRPATTPASNKNNNVISEQINGDALASNSTNNNGQRSLSPPPLRQQNQSTNKYNGDDGVIFETPRNSRTTSSNLNSVRRYKEGVVEKDGATTQNDSKISNNLIRVGEGALSIAEFDALNNKYVPPLDTNLPDVPSKYYEVICAMLSCVWGFASPRPYQVIAIFHLVFRKVGMMYLIRKTGEGKSLWLIKRPPGQ